jgi:hypothetical protein
MKMHMFVILDVVKRETENIRGLNLVAVKHRTVKIIKLPLQPELFLIRYIQFYRACAERSLVSILYMKNSRITCK